MDKMHSKLVQPDLCEYLESSNYIKYLKVLEKCVSLTNFLFDDRDLIFRREGTITDLSCLRLWTRIMKIVKCAYVYRTLGCEIGLIVGL